MSGAPRHAAPILAPIFLCALTPQLLRAQILVYFEADIVLSTSTSPTAGPTVRSSAKVTLYNGSDGNRLTSQVIMGHEVRDLTANASIYERRIVSETGEAGEVATMGGVIPHCYETKVGAHANAYNRHEVWTIGPVCANPPPEPPPNPDVPKEDCPVLLDLQQDGFHLSGPDPAVRFDIDADGIQDQIAWTQAGEDDAFLCWDRNRNGVIDDGRELFGYATPLLSGRRAKVGYRALAEFDETERGATATGRSIPAT